MKLLNEVKRAYRKWHRAVGAEMHFKAREAARASGMGLDDADSMARVVVAQNTLMPIVAQTLEDSLPADAPFFLELATRLAAQIITVLPPERQQSACEQMGAAVWGKVQDMHAQGYAMGGGWSKGGEGRAH